MKTWVKVLLGLAGGVVLLVGLGMVLLVRSSRWEQVKGLAGGISQLKKGTEDLERMQRERPFQPPADGLIPEPRLMAYLVVCETLQPFVQPYQAWMESHAGQRGDFKDAAEAIGFMGTVVDRASAACRSQAMTPQELAWMHRAVRKAVEEAQGRSTATGLAELLQDLRRAVADPGLSGPLKAELQQKLAGHEARAATGATPLSANARLCLRHAERIQRADLGDFAALILEGTAKGRRPGGW